MKFNVGDRIITTKEFKEGGPRLRGTIIATDFLENYKVLFDKKANYCHTIGDILLEKKGYVLCEREFKKIKKEDKNLEALSTYLNYFFITNSLCYKDDVARLQLSSKNTEETISRYLRELNEKKELLKKLEKNPPKFSFTNEINQQFLSIMKNKKIQSIDITDNYLIITTKSLTYKKTKGIKKEFELGQYKIFISFYQPVYVKAINITKQFRKHYSHPCVKQGGSMCLGQEVAETLARYLQKRRIDAAIFLLISFLEEPNYVSPYIQDYEFQYSQKRNFIPKNPEDYLNESLVGEKEVWDESLFEEESKNNI